MPNTTTPPTVSNPGPSEADDRAAIAALVADVEAGFNTNDPDLLISPFVENGTVVNVMGLQLDGRVAMLDNARTGLAGFLRDDRARYELVDLTFLRPDVAVGHKQGVAIGPDGEPIDVGHDMVALYVFVKEDGRWWVAARQNTLVPHD